MLMILSIVVVMMLMLVFALTNASSQAEAISEKHREELRARKYNKGSK
ncbi:hypothetical protein [Planomicrobium sp. CPCC 101079]|nr:hypothetical protein [Planomicrobium sp. CPCC 101079]